MGEAGKKIRMSRFFHERPRFGCVVPVDHGLTLGPLPGIESVARIAAWLRHPVVTGTIAHKGIIERLALRQQMSKLGVMVQLTGMCAEAAQPDLKQRLTSLEAAIALGADAVSVQTNFDGSNDSHNLRLIGAVVDDARKFGLPVLAMLYDTHPAGRTSARQAHIMRVAVELGVDAIKIGPPAQLADLPELLDGISADVDVFVAGGGAVLNEKDMFELAATALRSGAAGLCVGRNVFQRAAPYLLLDRLQELLANAAAEQSCASRPLQLEREPASLSAS